MTTRDYLDFVILEKKRIPPQKREKTEETEVIEKIIGIIEIDTSRIKIGKPKKVLFLTEYAKIN